MTDGATGQGPSGAPAPRDLHDNVSLYCRKLGHIVAFRYCREANDGVPCARVLDCCYELFDVAEYLCACFSPAELARAFAQPSDKIGQILDIVQAVKRGQGEP